MTVVNGCGHVLKRRRLVRGVSLSIVIGLEVRNASIASTCDTEEQRRVYVSTYSDSVHKYIPGNVR